MRCSHLNRALSRGNMPHQIDFDGLERDLFVLQHVAYGSTRFYSTIKLTRGCYGVTTSGGNIRGY